MIYSDQVKEYSNERGNKVMNRQNFTVAEELDEQKSKVSRERQLKLTKDRRNHNGNGKLAQTDGLKTIRKSVQEPFYIDDDDQPIDLTRVRNLSDVLKDTE
jgi:hypothetical protein